MLDCDIFARAEDQQAGGFQSDYDTGGCGHRWPWKGYVFKVSRMQSASVPKLYFASNDLAHKIYCQNDAR